VLYWTYSSTEHRDAGAIAPIQLNLPFGQLRTNSPIRAKDYAERWRLIESGERVDPSDCRPVRLLARFGFIGICPGNVVIRRLPALEKTRVFEPNYARFGELEVAGDQWPKSDSTRIASWIAGSAYAKIQTGISILYPTTHGLYQGPLPNESLLNVPYNKSIMAGIETVNGKNIVRIENQEYAVAELNVILGLPKVGDQIVIDRGEPIVWFFPVPGLKGLTLNQLL
jgi:hypothetical protein